VTTISTDGRLSTYINVFTCEPEQQDALVEQLACETDEVVSKLPGFVSANLHRSLDGRRVVNYAQWADLKAFQAMMRGERGKELIQGVHQYAKGVDVHLYEVRHINAGNGGPPGARSGSAAQLAEQAWAAISRGQVEELRALFDPDAELVLPTGSGRGVEHVVDTFRRHHAAFPDATHEILALLEGPGGDAVSRELRVSGTHYGTLRHPTSGAAIPPSGRRLIWRASEHIRTAAGRIVRWHAYFDRLAILEQLKVG
jgi:ketosteroid isomerase-like protein/quinol monooxygenase YgiN